MTIWTIYDHPRDYPHLYVARRFVWDQPTKETITSGSLEELRAQLRAMDLTCIQRAPLDDPVIVETWL